MPSRGEGSLFSYPGALRADFARGVIEAHTQRPVIPTGVPAIATRRFPDRSYLMSFPARITLQRQNSSNLPMNLHRPDAATPSFDPIADLLRDSKTIAVVGLSSNPFRPSHEVAAYLQSVGFKIIPVNPNESEVLGVKSYARLEDIPEPVDIVDVFRRSEDVPPVADSAIAIGARVLWLQQDITHPAAAEKARAAGLTVVEDACLYVEHKKRKLEFAG